MFRAGHEGISILYIIKWFINFFRKEITMPNSLIFTFRKLVIKLSYIRLAST